MQMNESISKEPSASFLVHRWVLALDQLSKALDIK